VRGGLTLTCTIFKRQEFANLVRWKGGRQGERAQGAKRDVLVRLRPWYEEHDHGAPLLVRVTIPTTSFNPLVGRKQIMSKSEVPHTIIRTVEDPVSTPMALARGKKNYTVKSIDPVRGLGDPKSVHDLKQFTSAGPRQPGGIDALMTEGVRKGQQLARSD